MKGKTSVLVTVMVSASLIFYCCKKNEIDMNFSDQIETIYKTEKPSIISTALFGHVLMVEKIGYNNKALDTLKLGNFWENKMDKAQLDLANITRTSYDNSAIQVILIPYKGSGENNLLIYSFRNGFIYTVLHKKILENGNTQMSLTSYTNGTEFYSYQINNENKFGKYKLTSLVPFQNYRNTNSTTFDGSDWDGTYYQPLSNNLPMSLRTSVDINNGDGGKTCYQQYPNDFKACMNCSVSECYSEWLCSAVCTLGGAVSFLACSAGWGLVCAGVGS